MSAERVVAAPLVVVSVGTYHQPFDRLIDWAAAWWRTRPEVGLLVQHGVSRPLPGADNRVMLPHAELLDAYAAASVVVLQGGAGGVMDALARGVTPILVPRLPEFNEVVDGHQVLFARELARLGLVHLAEDPATLAALLDRAVDGGLTTGDQAALALTGADRVLELLDAVPAPLDRGTRRRRLLRLPRDLVLFFRPPRPRPAGGDGPQVCEPEAVSPAPEHRDVDHREHEHGRAELHDASAPHPGTEGLTDPEDDQGWQRSAL